MHYSLPSFSGLETRVGPTAHDTKPASRRQIKKKLKVSFDCMLLDTGSPQNTSISWGEARSGKAEPYPASLPVALACATYIAGNTVTALSATVYKCMEEGGEEREVDCHQLIHAG